MASDETLIINSSLQDCDDDDDDDDVDYGNDHDHDRHHPHNLSRLSMCSSNMKTSSTFDEISDDHDMGMYMSRLSIEGSDGDADEEFSDDDDDQKEGKRMISLVSSDSDKETGCLSLPATPPRRRNRRGCLNNTDVQGIIGGVKEYASENEARKGLRNKMRRRNSSSRRRVVVRERWVERCWEKKGYNYNINNNNNKGSCGDHHGDEEMMMNIEQSNNNLSCESECLVITRAKGGRRNLCMDLEEVKACRDLGFELEHERMLEIPNRISMSAGSTIDTSSGGNSPIANWRISSPGDDPRDVKARLKVWAQAVALASTSHRHLSY